MAKVYVVFSGRNVGIFNSWEKCESCVKGYSGASYQSFKNIDDAKEAWNKFWDINLEETINKSDIQSIVVNVYIGNKVGTITDREEFLSSINHPSPKYVEYDNIEMAISMWDEWVNFVDETLTNMRDFG